MEKRTGILGIGHKMAFIMIPITFLLGLVNEYCYSNLKFPTSFIILMVGVILIISGIMVVAISIHQIMNGFRDRKLVTDGIYAYTRNPLYFGWIALILPGIILLFGLILLIPVPFIAYALFKILIREEETSLEEKYGNEYDEYKSKVNSFIPGFKRKGDS